MIKISTKKIGLNHSPFIIAEMSGNHNQSLERALKIVDQAAASGVSAIKLQTYTADTITLKSKSPNFLINDKNSLWFGKNLYQLYSEAHTPWDWHEAIFDRAKAKGIICFSSVFDETSVDFLEKLGTPAYKIASFENIHLPLIKKVAKTGKPLIVSTGMANIAELDETVRTIRSQGCENFILLKCTSSYPASPYNSNVITIPHMRKLFDCEVGLSDHTMGVGASVAAVAHGATLIEKHFTLSRADQGVDSTFSMEPDEMSLLVVEAKRAWQSLGKINYGPSNEELSSLAFRRSIYLIKNLKKGDKLTEENIRIVRPGHGMAPKYYDIVIGRKLIKNVKKGTPLDWNLLD